MNPDSCNVMVLDSCNVRVQDSRNVMDLKLVNLSSTKLATNIYTARVGPWGQVMFIFFYGGDNNKTFRFSMYIALGYFL